MEASFKILFTLGVLYTNEGLFSVQPYHFQADLIWCYGTFEFSSNPHSLFIIYRNLTFYFVTKIRQITLYSNTSFLSWQLCVSSVSDSGTRPVLTGSKSLPFPVQEFSMWGILFRLNFSPYSLQHKPSLSHFLLALSLSPTHLPSLHLPSSLSLFSPRTFPFVTFPTPNFPFPRLFLGKFFIIPLYEEPFNEKVASFTRNTEYVTLRAPDPC